MKCFEKNNFLKKNLNTTSMLHRYEFKRSKGKKPVKNHNQIILLLK